MLIQLPRFLLRDFEEADRPAFGAYQMDPRYLRLYDFSPADTQGPEKLFDLFLQWRWEQPRRNFQLGIFETRTGHLLGSAGLRRTSAQAAVIGIELAPAEWGRFRLASDIAAALLEYGFETLKLDTIIGNTASGNSRVEKLARRFGARIIACLDGPDWMQARGWQEVAWAIAREDWTSGSDDQRKKKQ